MAKYFIDDEFRCHCCGALHENGVDPRLLDVLDAMREEIGLPLIVLSGYRCPAHNAACGGASHSYHMEGCAADIACPDGVSVEKLAQLAEKHGADGIGRYYRQDFVHVDTRGYWARWSDRD